MSIKLWNRLARIWCARDEVMKRIAWKIALLTPVVSIAPVVAGEQPAVVRNCTWCHGTSGQGYLVAPRLAGQRPLYLETQIRSFREHTRNNPISKQYMWGAVAALAAGRARSRQLFRDHSA